MIDIKKTTSLNGTSEINSNVIINMRANITNETITINYTILDKKKYEANKQQCDKDIEDFKARIEEMIEVSKNDN